MGLYALFKDAAYDVMTRGGFIHQSNVFIRILNDEIVQAVTVKPVVNYEITAAVFPLCDPPKGLFDDTKQPYWAEDIELTFNGFVDFPHTERMGISRTLPPYYSKDNKYFSYTVENFRKAAELLEMFYMPRFDKICDLDSYLSWMDRGYEDYARIYRRIGDKSLLYKVCADGNFDWVDAYVERCILRWTEKEFGVYTRVDSLTEAELKLNTKYSAVKEAMVQYRERRKKEFDKIFCYKDSNDLSEVKIFIEEQRERTFDILKKKYSKLKL